MNLCAIGTGAITKSMLAEFNRSDVLHVTAIYSRKEETGKAMAEEFGIEKVYTSMDEMLADPAIDMVYVASPNSIHYSQAKAALLLKKLACRSGEQDLNLRKRWNSLHEADQKQDCPAGS